MCAQVMGHSDCRIIGICKKNIVPSYSFRISGPSGKSRATMSQSEKIPSSPDRRKEIFSDRGVGRLAWRREGGRSIVLSGWS